VDLAHFISGAQRLPNGNTLICSGENGRIIEVASDGKIAWRYQNTHGGDLKSERAAPPKDDKPDPNGPPAGGGGGPKPTSLFRATRIPFDHPGLAGKNLPEMAEPSGD